MPKEFPALLATCRRTYKEAAYFYYQSVRTTTFYATPDTAVTWMKLLPERSRRSVQSIRLLLPLQPASKYGAKNCDRGLMTMERLQYLQRVNNALNRSGLTFNRQLQIEVSVCVPAHDRTITRALWVSDDQNDGVLEGGEERSETWSLETVDFDPNRGEPDFSKFTDYSLLAQHAGDGLGGQGWQGGRGMRGGNVRVSDSGSPTRRR